MAKIRKIAQIGKECVACGCCAKVCPKGAVYVDSGVIAKVDGEKCIGCGKCAKTCPAAVITIAEREAAV
ncbi:MAG: 4Fe-4S binding protein [Bacillota bacterium]|jgi:ferredoxin